MVRHETRAKVVAEFTGLLISAGDPFDQAFEDAKMLERRIYKDSITKMLYVCSENIQINEDFTPEEIKSIMEKL